MLYFMMFCFCIGYCVVLNACNVLITRITEAL